MGAVASLSENALAAEPGGEAHCTLRVRNTGEVVDEFTLSFVGETAGWATADPPSLRLLPGTEDSATVRFRPPRTPDTSPGPIPFGVKVTSREDPEGSVVEEGVLEVAPFSDVVAELIPHTSKGRHRAKHDLAMDNRGNTRVNADVVAFDQEEALDFDLDPPGLVADPGTASFAAVRIRPRERYWRGPPRTRPFQVQVRSDGSEPLQLDGTMVQEAAIPSWLPRALLAAALLLLALVLLWFTLLRPTITSAAREAVEEPLADLAAQNEQQAQDIAAAQQQAAAADQKADQALGGAGPIPVASPTGGGGTGGDTADQPVATPFDFRLTANDPPGGAVTRDGLEVPDGQTLELTDVFLQNPRGHAGVVRVHRVVDGQSSLLLEVAMENFRDLDYHFVTPLVFPSGSTVRFEVECAQPVEGASACDAGAYFAGTMLAPSGTDDT